MPRVVPSQVVTMVKTMFPIVLEERYTKIALTRVTIEALSTVVELVESIPEELVTLEGPDYTYIAGHRDVWLCTADDIYNWYASEYGG